MLSRPHQAASSSIDRAQAAATFGVLGLFGGALLAIAVAWLYLLQQGLSKQNDSLVQIKQSVERTDDAQRIALDALISRTDPDVSPKSFRDTYSASLEKVGRLEAKTKLQETQNDILTDEAKRLQDEAAKLAKGKEEAESKAAKFEKLALEQDSILKALDKTDAVKISQRYDIAWYAALAGWIVAVLASLGLVANLAARTPPQMPGTPEAPRVIYSKEEPPHSIS